MFMAPQIHCLQIRVHGRGCPLIYEVDNELRFRGEKYAHLVLISPQPPAYPSQRISQSKNTGKTFSSLDPGVLCDGIGSIHMESEVLSRSNNWQ
jgi:thioesterase domain-containing protein